MLVIGQTRLLPCSVTVSCMLGAADRGVRMLQEGKCEAAALRSMGLNVSFVCVPDERACWGPIQKDIAADAKLIASAVTKLSVSPRQAA